MKSHILYFFLFLFGFNKSFASQVDSLKALLDIVKGKEKAIILNLLCDKYVSLNLDSALKYGRQGIEITKKEKLNLIYADILNNLGNIFLQKGEYSKSLDNYIEAEKNFNVADNLVGKVKTLINIGTVYELQDLFEKASMQYNSALLISINIGNKDFEAQIFTHLGSLYYSQKNKIKALDCFSHSLKINKEIKNTPRIMEGLNNVGVINQELGKFSEALSNFETFLNYAKKTQTKSDIIAAYHNIALVFKDQKNYPNAISYLDSSIYLAKKIKDFDDLREAYSTLSEIYKEQKNIEKAFEYFQLSAAAKDSLLNQTRDKQFIEMSTKYDTEKKETENKLLKAEGEKQKTINLSVSIGLILVALLSFFIFWSYRIKKKANVLLGEQNIEIREKKHIIEEKQKEILDSISYAKRLQEAILPPQEHINEYFPDNFVLYKPKDIVAGDFYWLEHIDNISFFAAADSTGHGVPGAMVSLVCSNALNRSVKEFGLRKTGEILDKTRELVLETFAKSNTEVKDGMDISLLSVQFPSPSSKNQKVIINWSGANNPLWYINSFSFNGVESNKFHEIKPNKQPIGKTDRPQSFTTHEIEHKTNTVFYLFTDGYPDQFGGPKGKKYKHKQLEEMLIVNSSKTLEEQKNVLDKAFKEWIGDLEQVDDVTIIGIRI